MKTSFEDILRVCDSDLYQILRERVPGFAERMQREYEARLRGEHAERISEAEERRLLREREREVEEQQRYEQWKLTHPCRKSAEERFVRLSAVCMDHTLASHGSAGLVLLLALSNATSYKGIVRGRTGDGNAKTQTIEKLAIWTGLKKKKVFELLEEFVEEEIIALNAEGAYVMNPWVASRGRWGDGGVQKFFPVEAKWKQEEIPCYQIGVKLMAQALEVLTPDDMLILYVMAKFFADSDSNRLIVCSGLAVRKANCDDIAEKIVENKFKEKLAPRTVRLSKKRLEERGYLLRVSSNHYQYSQTMAICPWLMRKKGLYSIEDTVRAAFEGFFTEREAI